MYFKSFFLINKTGVIVFLDDVLATLKKKNNSLTKIDNGLTIFGNDYPNLLIN
jgi:hypothetical protein